MTYRLPSLPPVDLLPMSFQRRAPTDKPAHEPLILEELRSDLLSDELTQSTLDDLLSIHEYERRRMGQDLHDSTGQLVVSLLFSLAQLKRSDDRFAEGNLIDEVEDIVREIDREIRSLAFLQHPAELGDLCLASSIEGFARGFARRTGMHISFKSVGDTPPMNESLSTALLRVTQEALVNVHRHAHATSVKIELKSLPGRIELRISDDGIGLPGPGDSGGSGGIGVLGMRHRIEAQGGRFELRNGSRGAVACAIVPISPVFDREAVRAE